MLGWGVTPRAIYMPGKCSTKTLPPLFRDKVSCNQSWPETQDVAKNDLELLLILSPASTSPGWGYLHMPHLGHAVSRLD